MSDPRATSGVPSNLKFDKIAGKYDGIFEKHLPGAHELLIYALNKHIPVSGNKTIIDIGSGTGATASCLAGLGIKECTVYGIDNSREMYNKALELKETLDSDETNSITYRPYTADVFSPKDWLYIVPDTEADFVVCSYAMHEIIGGDKNKVDELIDVFSKCIGDEGEILILDGYYPRTLSDEKIKTTKDWILKLFGHATPPEQLITPDELGGKFLERGFKYEIGRQKANPKKDLWCYSLHAVKT